MKVPVDRRIEFKEVVARSRLSPLLRHLNRRSRRRSVLTKPRRLSSTLSSAQKFRVVEGIKYTTKKRGAKMANVQLNERQAEAAQVVELEEDQAMQEELHERSVEEIAIVEAGAAGAIGGAKANVKTPGKKTPKKTPGKTPGKRGGGQSQAGSVSQGPSRRLDMQAQQGQESNARKRKAKVEVETRGKKWKCTVMWRFFIVLFHFCVCYRFLADLFFQGTWQPILGVILRSD